MNAYPGPNALRTFGQPLDLQITRAAGDGVPLILLALVTPLSVAQLCHVRQRLTDPRAVRASVLTVCSAGDSQIVLVVAQTPEEL